MKLANATSLDRKSGVAQRRDLRFHFRQKRMCRGRIASRFRFSIKANRRAYPERSRTGPSASLGMTNLRAAADLGIGGDEWTEALHSTNPISLVHVLFHAFTKLRRPEGHLRAKLVSPG
jgi:hypothetical protein